jgi:ElaB/YqjD/DUF883 family membrane-anchored ribosome-binding protein
MNGNPMSSAFEMFRMMANAAEAFNRFSSVSDTPRGQSERLMRLHMAYVNSGYRYLARWAEIAVRRYPEFQQTFVSVSQKPQSKAELNKLLDEARAFMREMAELPREEAEHLRDEIDAIMGEGKGKKHSRPKKKKSAPPKAKRRHRSKR